MKKLMFIVLGFFVMSAFTSPINKEEMNNLKNTLQEAQQEKEDLDADLFAAVDKGDNEEVNNLLEQGANPNARMDWGEFEDIPVLFFAISKKFPTIVDSLVSKGADGNMEYQEETPLLFTINNTEYDVEDNDSYDIVRALVRHSKADIFKVYDQESFSGTILTLAVQKRQFKIMDFLLLRKNGKLANIQSPSNGYTPLMYAIEENDLELVKHLLWYKFDLSIRDNNGRTAVQLAQENIDQLNTLVNSSEDNSEAKELLSQAKAIKQALKKDLAR
jgi:ankyrin repeat protein